MREKVYERFVKENNIAGQYAQFMLANEVNNLAESTMRYYEQKVGEFIKFCINLDINDVTHIMPSHVRLFMLKLQETNNPTSCHDFYRAIKRFFNWSIDEGILLSSPIRNIKPPKVPKKVVQPFTIEQIKELLNQCGCSTLIGLRDRALILIFLDTGLRLSEIANIKLDDIDKNKEIIKVMGKGAKERIVRIGNNAREALLDYLRIREDENPFLWISSKNFELTARGIELRIHSLGVRAKISGVRCSPHTFRHTFATNSLINGANEFNVQSLLGHSTLTMTRRYVSTLDSSNAVIGHRKFSPADNIDFNRF